MKRSCSNFSCKKLYSECTACVTSGKKKGALCMPTCDICKNKSTCNLPKDLNKQN
ncbi:MAG: hypothetical protein IJE43_19620 [Alphaproteobacteria bacterium]|nr:hypothetical protein [Alphaproteobacteria bacterium]